jgi:hypothetical protein
LKFPGQGSFAVRGTSFVILACFALASATPALCAQDDDDNDKPGKGGARVGKIQEKERVETENMFGFTEGSDTGEAGERELTTETLWRKRRMLTPYSAMLGKLNFEYSARDDVKLGVAASYDRYRFPAGPSFDLEGDSALLPHWSAAVGLSGELKYRLLERGSSPVGLAISFEPEWRRVVSGRGLGISLVQFQTKFMADAALVPERVFIAANASWEPQVTWMNSGETTRDTNIELSAAVSARLFEGLFVGGEVRYLASFEGLSFKTPPDYGFFVGPTLYAKISERVYVAAAWSIRVGGRIRSDPEPLPDFGNVPDHSESHHVRVKAGVSF